MKRFSAHPLPLAKTVASAPSADNTRRRFLKTTALGGIPRGSLFYASVEDVGGETTSRNRRPAPGRTRDSTDRQSENGREAEAAEKITI